MATKARPYEYVHYALKMRPELLKIINDNYTFCLIDPESYMRKLCDIIGDILKRFKQLMVNYMGEKTLIIRNLAIGVPAGFNDFKSYSKWSKFNDD